MTRRRRYAVLFGFRADDKGETGYFRAGPGGCAVTGDRGEATRFSLEADRPGWRPPEDWCRFLRDEPATRNWRFHPVVITEHAETRS